MPKHEVDATVKWFVDMVESSPATKVGSVVYGRDVNGVVQAGTFWFKDVTAEGEVEYMVEVRPGLACDIVREDPDLVELAKDVEVIADSAKQLDNMRENADYVAGRETPLPEHSELGLTVDQYDQALAIQATEGGDLREIAKRFNTDGDFSRSAEHG